MKNSKHYAAAIIAFVGWGFFSIPLRSLKSHSAGEILYFRILFSALIMIGIVLAFRRKALQNNIVYLKTLSQKEKIRIILLTLFGGVLLSVNWLTFIYIVNNINIKTASFSYLVCPVLTAVLAFILLKEKLSGMQWFAVAICAASCALIGLESVTELTFSLVTAFSYALYLVSQRRVQGVDRMITLGVQIVFSIFLLSLFFNQLVHAIPDDSKFYSTILLIAAVFTVLPLFLNLYALNRIDSATIGILMYLNPLFNFSVAFLVFDESLNTVQLAGYGAILIAIILFNLENFVKIRRVIQTK